MKIANKPLDLKKFEDDQLRELLDVLLATARGPIGPTQRAEIEPIIEKVATEIGLRIEAQISQ